MGNLQMMGGTLLIVSLPIAMRLYNICKMTDKQSKDNQTPVINGAFEIHLTVGTNDKPDDQARFTEICKKIDVKPVYILLPHGANPKQLMTSSYTVGTRDTAIMEAKRLVKLLHDEGWTVKRFKIEALASNTGVPETDDEHRALKAKGEGIYFEFHYKCKCRDEADKLRLTEVGKKYNAHTSRSAFKKNMDDGSFINFLTLREYDMGKINAMKKFNELLADLKEAGFEVVGFEREYAVCDDNVGLDAGWL